jgi:hypothetical protein
LRRRRVPRRERRQTPAALRLSSVRPATTLRMRSQRYKRRRHWAAVTAARVTVESVKGGAGCGVTGGGVTVVFFAAWLWRLRSVAEGSLGSFFTRVGRSRVTIIVSDTVKFPVRA